jgi:hypothetical protein
MGDGDSDARVDENENQIGSQVEIERRYPDGCSMSGSSSSMVRTPYSLIT